MSLIGGYATGSSASAKWYSTVDELLSQLPDNTGQLIQASDIRDSVYSLWAHVGEVESIALSASSVGAVYTNSNSVPYTIGGVTAGTTFAGNYTMQQMFDKLLYPYVLPGASMSLSTNIREFGSPLSVVITWTAIQNTNTISSIIVDGTPKSFPPYSGTVNANGTYSLPLISLQSINTFTVSVTDTVPSTFNVESNLYWRHRMYWGRYNFGNINLTTNPGSASYMSSLLSDSSVRSMSSGNANGSLSNSDLVVDKYKSLSNIDGSGNHLIFAWPTLFPDSTNPNFTVNGLVNNAFTRLKTGYSFTNQYGLTASYEIWVSNTIQNSPINLIIS